jgi:tetratricopeptide (TPR) repeat protein
LPKLLRSKNIPLDIQSERTRLIQKALEGSPADLAKATQTKNSPIAQDTEILLTLARAYTLTNNHAEAAKFYAAAQNVTRLASNTDNRIEQGYALLLKGDFHKAERTFAALREQCRGSGDWTQRIQKSEHRWFRKRPPASLRHER